MLRECEASDTTGSVTLLDALWNVRAPVVYYCYNEDIIGLQCSYNARYPAGIIFPSAIYYNIPF